MELYCRDIISQSYCISIDSKRMENLNKVFTRVFRCVPKLVRGFTSSCFSPIMRCALSHQTIVRMAKAMNLPYVCIFEDDAYPRDDAPLLIDRFMRSIPEDAKIIVLGYNKVNRCIVKNSEVNIVTPSVGIDFSVWGSHAYIIFSSAYDEYLDIFENDPELSSDGYFSRIVPTYVAKTNIFIQRCDSKSMNGHSGYIWDNISHENPPEGFKTIEYYLR